MSIEDVARLSVDQAAVAPSDGRLTDVFMAWWAAYAELLRAERRDERGRQIAHLQSELESARVTLAKERVDASRPSTNTPRARELAT